MGEGFEGLGVGQRGRQVVQLNVPPIAAAFKKEGCRKRVNFQRVNGARTVGAVSPPPAARASTCDADDIREFALRYVKRRYPAI